ncbi:MAG: phage/plasmid primase, P4 family [Limnobacter sp.]|uniref:DNA primase family protein n=1 Tax=Limnobacter sp. TaxID=2003368 RepID=UPI0032EDDB41
MTEPMTITAHADHLLDELGLKFECSEVGNMERFVAHHKDKVRYVPERKRWVLWDGTRWKRCGHSDVHALALETAKGIYDEARDCKTEEGRKRSTQWALGSQNERRIRSMINMASNAPDLVASIGAFDTDPAKINCQNGVVDLKTGELIGHSSSELVMKLAPVNYLRHAKCPTFSKFLHSIFNGDVELIRWMQRAIGYTLTGLTNEQLFFLAYGTGANGKSTLFETILDVLGDYGRAAEFDTFLASDRSNTRVMEGVAKLQGIRFALASETDSAKRFSEALVKQITGGDTVTGSFLYGASFEFRPDFKLWLLANHLPFAKDGSHGFWRRVKVVPFARRFTKDEMDQTLRAKLMSEAEGIFAWCVRGAVSWFKRMEETGGQSGIGTCDAVDEATNVYRSDQDLLGQFIEDRLGEDKGNEVPAKVLYTAYEDWCREAGEQTPCAQSLFSKRLEERDILKKRKKSGVVYLDVRLNGHYDDEYF